MTEEDLRNLMLNDRPGQHGSNPESDDGSVTGLLHRNTEQEDNHEDDDNAEQDSHVDEDHHSDRADHSSVHSAPDAPSTAHKRTLPSNLHLNVPKFDWSAQNKWQEFQTFRLELDMIFANVGYCDLTAKDKVYLILNWMGLEARKKFQSWSATERYRCEQELEYFLNKLSSGWQPSGNSMFARLEFAKLTKDKQQTADEFLELLCFKAQECNFGRDEESRLCDAFVNNVTDQEMQKELLKIVRDDTPLETLLTVCHQLEAQRVGSALIHGKQFDSVHGRNRQHGQGRG